MPDIMAELGDFLVDGGGRIHASALIAGTLDHPAATLAASSDGLDIGGTHIDSAQADVALEDDLLQVKLLTARQKEGSLEASGVVNLATEQMQGNAIVSNFQITDVRDFSATVNMNADIAGSFQEPSATVKGQLAKVVYAGQEHGMVAFDGIANRQTAEFRLESPKYRATVEGAINVKAPYAFSATIDARQSPLQHQQYDFVADGRVRAEGELQPMLVRSLHLDAFTLMGEGVDLKAGGSLDTGVKVDLAADLAQLPVETVELTGTATVAAVVTGPLDNVQVNGDLQTANATVKTSGMPQPAAVESAVNFDRNRFTIRAMRAQYADARAVIEGSGTLNVAPLMEPASLRF
jgi:autotransporter translocation and assembly factor TamB